MDSFEEQELRFNRLENAYQDLRAHKTLTLDEACVTHEVGKSNLIYHIYNEHGPTAYVEVARRLPMSWGEQYKLPDRPLPILKARSSSGLHVKYKENADDDDELVIQKRPKVRRKLRNESIGNAAPEVIRYSGHSSLPSELTTEDIAKITPPPRIRNRNWKKRPNPDEDRRQKEREAKKEGKEESLIERVRSGELSEERVEMGAALGDSTCRELMKSAHRYAFDKNGFRRFILRFNDSLKSIIAPFVKQQILITFSDFKDFCKGWVHDPEAATVDIKDAIDRLDSIDYEEAEDILQDEELRFDEISAEISSAFLSLSDGILRYVQSAEYKIAPVRDRHARPAATDRESWQAFYLSAALFSLLQAQRIIHGTSKEKSLQNLKSELINFILDQKTRHNPDRKHGKSLPETGYEFKYATIYRAASGKEKNFNPMDYVTLSKKFAVGHAEHSLIYHEEQQHVLKAMVPAKDVYEAYNPGEYFYNGHIITGQVIYRTAESPD